MGEEKPVLTYFDARGRAEIIRLIFSQSGVNFQDNRFRPQPNALEDFRNLKESKEIPFGQVPILEIDGLVLAQSQAIVRYTAQKYGLAGATPQECAMCDMISCGTEDLRQKFTNVVFISCEKAREQNLKNFQDEILPKWATYFARLLERNGGEWFVGSGVTYADLAVYDCFAMICLRIPASLCVKRKCCEILRAHRARVESLPNIAEWLKTRPENSV